MADENNTIQKKIRAVAGTIPGTRYLFANWAQANVALDDIAGPTIVYILPPSGNIDIDTYAQRAKDRPLTQIAFLCRTDLDFPGTANDDIVESMKRLFLRFARAYNDSGYFSTITDTSVPYQVLYDHLDDNLTGIVVTLTIEEEEGVSVCGDPEALWSAFTSSTTDTTDNDDNE